MNDTNDTWWSSEILISFPNGSVIHELLQLEVEDRSAHVAWFLCIDQMHSCERAFPKFWHNSIPCDMSSRGDLIKRTASFLAGSRDDSVMLTIETVARSDVTCFIFVFRSLDWSSAHNAYSCVSSSEIYGSFENIAAIRLSITDERL